MGSTINSSTEAIDAFILEGTELTGESSVDSGTSKSLTRGTVLCLEPFELISKFLTSINSLFICSISFTADSSPFQLPGDCSLSETEDGSVLGNDGGDGVDSRVV